MAWPTRTGLTSMKYHAERIKALETKYAEVQSDILNPDQLEKIANLILCVTEFLRDVPSHEPIV